MVDCATGELLKETEPAPKYFAQAAASMGHVLLLKESSPTSQIFTFSIVTPLAWALDNSLLSHCGKSGSSTGPNEPGLVLEFPAPVSERDSGLLCNSAKAMASCIDQPGELGPGVGFCWLALVYCQKCSRLTGLNNVFVTAKQVYVPRSAGSRISRMATYTIVPPKHRDAGFLGTIVGDDGARNTCWGLGTEEQAQQWIEADQARKARRPAED